LTRFTHFALAPLKMRAISLRSAQVMVQNDIMRLDVKRLRDALNGKADQVFNLENRKQQLNLSMEERKREIAVHAEVRAAQLRAAEEEKHKNSVELGQRRSAVEKLKSKVSERRTKRASLS